MGLASEPNISSQRARAFTFSTLSGPFSGKLPIASFSILSFVASIPKIFNNS